MTAALIAVAVAVAIPFGIACGLLTTWTLDYALKD